MHRSTRSQDDKVQDWILPVIGILIALAIAWGIGQLQARETYKRQHIPTAYAEAAKNDAERACVGTEPSVVFKCVNEKVETAYQTAHDQQDLSAQQRAASSALLTTALSFMALVLSAFGVWFIKRTLDATLKAVEETGNATAEMKAANEIAKASTDRQSRAYLIVTDVMVENYKEGQNPTFSMSLMNCGQAPAKRVRGLANVFFETLMRGHITAKGKPILRFDKAQWQVFRDHRGFDIGPGATKKFRFTSHHAVVGKPGVPDIPNYSSSIEGVEYAGYFRYVDHTKTVRRLIFRYSLTASYLKDGAGNLVPQSMGNHSS